MPFMHTADSAAPCASEGDFADCRRRLRVGSRSFHAAAFLLPPDFHEPASALYAFCRAADDAVDDSHAPGASLSGMQRRLDAIYSGRPCDNAEDRALCAVVTQYALPKALLEALFEGFCWDVEARRYRDLSAVRAYSARVAGTVGSMMAMLMGVRDADRLARASDLGVAMQLSNIARDVGEDARAGRLYLPLDWLHEAGIDAAAFMQEPTFSVPLGSVVQRLLDEAERLYRRADSGIAALPARFRPAIFAARLLYREIGREVARNGYDSVSRRAVVATPRKLAVLTGLARLATLSRDGMQAPPLDEAEFLVAASQAGDVTELRIGSPSLWRRAERNYVWVLDLFAEMERRERIARGRPLTGKSTA